MVIAFLTWYREGKKVGGTRFGSRHQARKKGLSARPWGKRSGKSNPPLYFTEYSVPCQADTVAKRQGQQQ